MSRTFQILVFVFESMSPTTCQEFFKFGFLYLKACHQQHVKNYSNLVFVFESMPSSTDRISLQILETSQKWKIQKKKKKKEIKGCIFPHVQGPSNLKISLCRVRNTFQALSTFVDGHIHFSEYTHL